MFTFLFTIVFKITFVALIVVQESPLYIPLKRIRPRIFLFIIQLPEFGTLKNWNLFLCDNSGISYICAHVPMSLRARTSVPDEWFSIKVTESGWDLWWRGTQGNERIWSVVELWFLLVVCVTYWRSDFWSVSLWINGLLSAFLTFLTPSSICGGTAVGSCQRMHNSVSRSNSARISRRGGCSWRAQFWRKPTSSQTKTL